MEDQVNAERNRWFTKNMLLALLVSITCCFPASIALLFKDEHLSTKQRYFVMGLCMIPFLIFAIRWGVFIAGIDPMQEARTEFGRKNYTKALSWIESAKKDEDAASEAEKLRLQILPEARSYHEEWFHKDMQRKTEEGYDSALHHVDQLIKIFGENSKYKEWREQAYNKSIELGAARIHKEKEQEKKREQERNCLSDPGAALIVAAQDMRTNVFAHAYKTHSVSVQNPCGRAIKDVTLKITYFAQSNTEVDSKTDTIYQIILPHSSSVFRFNALSHPQAAYAVISISDASFAE